MEEACKTKYVHPGSYNDKEKQQSYQFQQRSLATLFLND